MLYASQLALSLQLCEVVVQLAERETEAHGSFLLAALLL